MNSESSYAKLSWRKNTMATCECGKEITWLKTSSGKSMPVNTDSIPETDKKSLRRGDKVLFDYRTMVSHFSDCPNADKFRKEK